MMMTREAYYAQIKDMYAQKYESKLHGWQKTREDYYAQIEDIYAQMYGESHAPHLYSRSRKGKKENPEDQALNDKELVETGVATDPIETEHYSVMDDETDILEEKSTSQFQVPMAKSEIVRSIEPGKVDLGLENEEYVVLNENLEQEGDQKNVKRKNDVDGVVEKDQKVMSDTKICYAHQLFDQKPVRVTHKEKHMKHLKAWKFKFKPNSKRSRLMDDKFFFEDATVLLNKDPKETIWDCVKKELKETMAACEKNRVGRFKLAEEKESKLQVLDLHQTFMCHQIGRVWEPGGLPNKMDLWDWFETELKACGESQQVERFLYSLMQVVKRNLEFKTFESNKTFSDSDIASFIGLEICGFETKKYVLLLMKLANRVWKCGELLATHVYHKWLEKKKLRNVEDGVKQDKNRFSGVVGAKVFMASEELHLLQDVFEMVKELLLKTSLVSPQVMRNTKLKFTKQWMFKFRTKNIDQWLGGYNLSATYLENKKTWMFKYKAPNLDTKVFKTSGQCIKRRLFVSVDRGTKNNKPTLRFLMNTKQSCLSLRANRVWDPGGSSSEND